MQEKIAEELRDEQIQQKLHQSPSSLASKKK